MAGTLVEALGAADKIKGSGIAIAPGVVMDNINLLLEGKVLVRIPSLPSFQPWARMVSVGGGSGRGFMWLPQVGDEVLVAFDENDETDAYVLGGLWNTVDRPPAIVPTDFVSKRILKTGLVGGLGHTVEFDDALQSITITTSTQQKVTLNPTKIALSTAGGAMSITLDLAAVPPAVSVQVLTGNISLSAPAGKIALDALEIELQADTSVTIGSLGPCSVQGLPIKLN
jgi:phage baseplate assembly protein gpV